MRVQQWLLAGALVAMPALAAAQTTTTTTQPGDTTTTTQTQTTTRADFDDLDSDPGGWFASAHIGSDFGAEADGNSLDFGGALGYTNGWIGAEFLAGFTPSFQLENNILLDEPQINSYMFNVMGGVPIGTDVRFQPYVSGGLGALTLRSDVLTPDENAFNETFDPNDTQLGANIGFGVMGFGGNVGVRADVRYFRGFSDESVEDALGLDPGSVDPNSSAAGDLASSILSELDFWRANIGIAFRW